MNEPLGKGAMRSVMEGLDELAGLDIVLRRKADVERRAERLAARGKPQSTLERLRLTSLLGGFKR